MFFEMGYRDAAALDEMAAAFRPWLRRKMESTAYLAWVAVASEEAMVAGLGLWLMGWPPHMIGPGAPRGNILNVYTDATYRRQGIARLLMKVALDWCRANGIRAVILHASDEHSCECGESSNIRCLSKVIGEPSVTDDNIKTPRSRGSLRGRSRLNAGTPRKATPKTQPSQLPLAA